MNFEAGDLVYIKAILAPQYKGIGIITSVHTRSGVVKVLTKLGMTFYPMEYVERINKCND